MKKSSIMLIGLLVLVVACDKSTKETPNGMKYKVFKSGDGITPKVGELLVFDFIMKDSKDSVWQSTYETGMPAAVIIGDTSEMNVEGSMMQMFRQLSKGDSVSSVLPITKVFREIMRSKLPSKIDSTLNITYLVHAKEITNKEKYMAMQQEVMKKKSDVQLGKDTVAIDQYLKEKGIAAAKTASGLRYVITKPGQGANATSGQKVKVNYTGYLLNGKYFDTNVKAIAQEKGLYDARREPYAPYDLVVDQSNVIKGWHEAIKQMSKGSKGSFYIPSTLGYGSQRASEVIAENSILIFDIEVLDISNVELDKSIIK